MKTIHIIADSTQILQVFSNRKDALTHLTENTVYTFRQVDNLVYEYMLRKFGVKHE